MNMSEEIDDQETLTNPGSTKATLHPMLKKIWLLCLGFTFIYFIVAVIAADDNHKADGGSKGAGFAAMWSCVILLFVSFACTYIIVRGKASSFFVGMVIGASAMLTQLFFVLMFVFFVFGESAGHDYDVSSTDKAFGSFCLFHTLLFGAWTVFLFRYRETAISDITNANKANGSSVTGSSSSSGTKGYKLPTSEDDVVDIDLDGTQGV